MWRQLPKRNIIIADIIAVIGAVLGMGNGMVTSATDMKNTGGLTIRYPKIMSNVNGIQILETMKIFGFTKMGIYLGLMRERNRQ